MEKSEQTIVIKRVKKIAGGHHGGAWKIAFADFALALMAFFLVMWLIESTTDLEKMVIAGYFSDPRSLANSGDGGTPYVVDLGGRPLTVANQGLNLALVQEDQEQMVEASDELENPEVAELARLRAIENLQSLRGQIEEVVAGNQSFEWFGDSATMEVTNEGLAIQIMDRENRPIFDSGSAQMRPYALEVLWAMAGILGAVPNKVSIYGHTDSVPFGNNGGLYSNWELSSDRANSARRALVEGGLPEDRFAQIIGMGSSMPFDQIDTTSQSNRRIVIMVLNELAEQNLREDAIESEQNGITPPEEAQPRGPMPEIF
ncbi:flagellar motor protein MotB [Gammaproteobacteria bacterium LSUCC0112]|nr:flagellar motor protein MotB [Gammaproteobacteria bacterium LSUCC0112]